MRRSLIVIGIGLVLGVSGGIGVATTSSPSTAPPAASVPRVVPDSGQDLEASIAALQDTLRRVPADHVSWANLAVAYVEQAHRRVGMHRAVVHREDVGAGEREHRVDAVRGGHRHGVGAAVGLDGLAGLDGLVRGLAGRARGVGHGRNLPSRSPGRARWWRVYAVPVPSLTELARAHTELTDEDVRLALEAAAAVGDDRIQERTQGQVTQESWTHGSAEQRVRWFKRGLESGRVADCDTFRTAQL